MSPGTLVAITSSGPGLPGLLRVRMLERLNAPLERGDNCSFYRYFSIGNQDNTREMVRRQKPTSGSW